jgi:hypothetical protein
MLPARSGKQAEQRLSSERRAAQPAEQLPADKHTHTERNKGSGASHIS